ncbi:hypothetical protein TWF481_007821 [Arthrobotrys musiformis]|uniref:F-box domain-containing protein n=1 Tax=Arthrobotrys musiformis TaxID=47236 RepID=A0AAV9W5A9_9PEZI
MGDIELGLTPTDTAIQVVAVDTALQSISRSPAIPPLLLLPYELILEIASHLNITDPRPGQNSKDYNSLSQTCRRLRQIFYPIANRHLWYDQETQFPDTLLSIVLYSFTDPLVEYVKSATFRLRRQDGEFWLKDEYDEAIEAGIGQLKAHIKKKAEEGNNEAFEFFESQIDEYGMSILPTVLLFQLKELKEIELAPSIHAISSRFLLTTLHYFKPPFQINRLGMVRLTDFASVNYWLLERFLRLGPIQSVGIDYRFGSTSGHPKIRPAPELPNYVEDKWEPDLESESDDDISVMSLEPEETAMVEAFWPRSGNRFGSAWRETTEEEIEEHFKGYQSTGWQECWFPTEISYELPGANPSSSSDTPFEIQDLRLWMDETAPVYERLIPLLHKTIGLRRFDLNLFPMWGRPQPLGLGTLETLDFQWLAKLLEKQIDTLESLSIRVLPFGAPQPHVPSLLRFHHLRKAHLFCTSDMMQTFLNRDSTTGPYFESMFPQNIEFLRIDFCYNVKLVEDVVNLQTNWFPNLRVVLGMFKDENASASRVEGWQNLWSSMPYQENPSSGSWEKREEIPEPSVWKKIATQITGYPDISSDPPVWRRKSLSHIPVQYLIITGHQKNVWCSHEGWYGPFQQHTSSDMPWDGDAFESAPEWEDDRDTDENNYSRLDPFGGPWIGTPQEHIDEMRG